MKIDDRLLFNVRESARILGVGVSTMWKLVLSGAVPSIRIGGKRMLRREVIEHISTSGVDCGPVRDLPTKVS